MIEIQNLVRKFDTKTVLDNFSLTIPEGDFQALLGPNGAGKTTLLRVMTTLLKPNGGQILVDGERVSRANCAVKSKFGIVTQDYSLRSDFTVAEVLELHGRIHKVPAKARRERADRLLAFCQMEDARDKIARQLSGGMKRKLMLCRGLMTAPKYLLLDEPTVGLDPISRRQIWQLLYRLNQEGMTILLTTHYIEEAQHLSKRVALINHGRLEVVAPPDVLIEELGAYTVEEYQDGAFQREHFASREDALVFLTKNPQANLCPTTLEDVFISYVGEGIGDGLPNGALGKMG